MPQKSTTRISTAQTPSKVFIDTGGWIAVTSEDDDLHTVGAPYFEAIVRGKARLFTSDYVLDESITRLRYDCGHAVALQFIRSIQEAERARSLEVLNVDRRTWIEATTRFERYADQDFSFTDCTSFVLAREAAVDAVFTFDHHFSILGFVIAPVATAAA
jgi:uncharacterized protein